MSASATPSDAEGAEHRLDQDLAALLGGPPVYRANQRFTSGAEPFAEDVVSVGCAFIGITQEGADLSHSVFVDCTFQDCDLYWGHAFEVVFIKCTFTRCDLRLACDNTLFAGCSFTQCEVGPNQLGGTTEWERCTVVDCTVDGPPLPVI